MSLFRKYTVLTFLVLFAFSVSSRSDWFDNRFSSSGYGSGGGEYLKLPIHARTAGLATATVAWRDQLSGLQFNPAILDVTDSITIIATKSFLTLDRSHNGFDIASGVGEYLVAGLSFSQFGIGGIEGRDEFGVVTESFSAGFNTLSVAIAGRLNIPISLGLRGRYLFESIENEHSNGMGFDLGATWQPIKQLTIGASAQNIGSYIWWSTNARDQVLMTGRFGICTSLFDNALRLEFDGIKTLAQPEEAAVGVEYTFAHIISGYGGIRTSVSRYYHAIMQAEYTFGTGMRFDFLGFDYALIVPPSELGIIHKISIIGKIPGF